MNKKLKLEELKRIDAETYKSAKKTPITVVLDNIRSAHNVGALFRTVDAFRLETIFLCGITPQPPHKEIRKTALGASKNVDWQYFEYTADAVEQLRADGRKIAALEQAEQTIPLNEYLINPSENWAIVFGNEVDGVQQNIIDLCDEIIEIPQFGTKHSLNVSVSAGITLWSMMQQYQK